MLLEIGLLKRKKTTKNKKQQQQQKTKAKQNKSQKKIKIALSLGYPSSYFYNKRYNMLLLWLYLSFS